MSVYVCLYITFVFWHFSFQNTENECLWLCSVFTFYTYHLPYSTRLMMVFLFNVKHLHTKTIIRFAILRYYLLVTKINVSNIAIMKDNIRLLKIPFASIYVYICSMQTSLILLLLLCDVIKYWILSIFLCLTSFIILCKQNSNAIDYVTTLKTIFNHFIPIVYGFRLLLFFIIIIIVSLVLFLLYFTTSIWFLFILFTPETKNMCHHVSVFLHLLFSLLLFVFYRSLYSH